MSDSTRNSRLAAYKNAGQGNTDMRRKRAELSVSLRKQAREEQLLKRRAMSPEAGDAPDEKTMTPQEIVKGLKSNDVILMTTCARAARRMLSREQNPPITMMVNAGVIPPLVDALDCDECADLQFEASWALTNIASGSHDNTMSVVDGGAIPHLIPLVARGDTVGEQCAWCLGNIAGDGAAARDAVLEAGALPALLPLLKAPVGPNAQALARLKTAVWVYSNLCRNKDPLVKFEMVSPALGYISELLEFEDNDVLADACWALSYLTDGPNDRIEGVQQTKLLLPRLVRLLGHKAHAVKTPALRAVGNMLTGSDEQTDRCLDAGCMEYISLLLQNGTPSLVKEAAWAASNILAGTSEQIDRALRPPGRMLIPLVNALSCSDPKSQKEAAWAITNLCLGGSGPQLDILLSAGALEPYTALLASRDTRAAAVVLDGLLHLLQAAEKYGQVEALCLKLEEIGVVDKLEELQQHENETIYKKTVQIIDTYFSEPTEGTAQPEQTDEQYQFGTNAEPHHINF